MSLKRFSLFVLLIGLLAGCSEDEINKDHSDSVSPGNISVTVDYKGTKKVLRLGVAVNDSPQDPPAQMPLKVFYTPQDPVEKGLKFPYHFNIPNLAPGTYYVKVYGDIDPSDGPLPNYHLDPQTPFEGPIHLDPGNTSSLEVTLQDDYQPGGPGKDASEETQEVTPKPGKGAIYGTVTYDGNKTGPLYVAVFKEVPPKGPPIAMARIQSPVFPQSYQINNVSPGHRYVIAYIDVNNKLMLAPEDPSSGYKEFDIEESQILQIDLSLNDPKK